MNSYLIPIFEALNISGINFEVIVNLSKTCMIAYKIFDKKDVIVDGLKIDVRLEYSDMTFGVLVKLFIYIVEMLRYEKRIHPGNVLITSIHQDLRIMRSNCFIAGVRIDFDEFSYMLEANILHDMCRVCYMGMYYTFPFYRGLITYETFDLYDLKLVYRVQDEMTYRSTTSAYNQALINVYLKDKVNLNNPNTYILKEMMKYECTNHLYVLENSPFEEIGNNISRATLFSFGWEFDVKRLAKFIGDNIEFIFYVSDDSYNGVLVHNALMRLLKTKVSSINLSEKDYLKGRNQAYTDFKLSNYDGKGGINNSLIRRIKQVVSDISCISLQVLSFKGVLCELSIRQNLTMGFLVENYQQIISIRQHALDGIVAASDRVEEIFNVSNLPELDLID